MKIKIGILGLGGVGGYFGGMLAKKYNNSKSIEIIFITKPETKKIIQKKGLTLELPTQKTVINNCIVVSHDDSIKELDYLFCCVKSYDLENALKSVSNGITEKTIIIPLLNGVNSKMEIKKSHPKSQVIEACAYIVSKISEPGVISVSSQVKSLYFGSNEVGLALLQNLNSILIDAEIDSHSTDNIEATLWEKFIFVSSLATATTYLNKSIGQILESEDHKQVLLLLISEIKTLIIANEIVLPNSLVQNTMDKIKSLPYQATTSMHNDFKNRKKTEYQILTEYVVKMAEEKNLDTPIFKHIHLNFHNWSKAYL